LDKKIVPFTNKQFQRLQYILYNGINKDEYDFRQVFLNNLIQDFEKENGALTWAQRSNIVSQFEEELFENYDHLKCLEDVLENLEKDFGFYKKFKKEVSLDWVDSEVKKARELYLIHSPEEAKKQREFVERESQNHRKFIHIGRGLN
jgi:ribosomal protein S21